MDQPLLFSSRRTTSYCEPNFVFLQLASLPIEHKSQKTIIAFENFPKPVELVETFQTKWSFWKLFRTGGAFGNFPGHYMETFQNMGCMHGHTCTKTKPVALLVGRRPFCWLTVVFLDVIPWSMCSPSSDGSGGMHS
jgi:hypothetical protein